MKIDGNLPSLISIVGVDGCGKTTLATWLENELVTRDLRTVRVWSRFRNYLSKPLLALTRLTGHNYYRCIDGVKFGYHEFERLPFYRELFALLQAVDVNLAAYWYIHRMRPKADVVICERGPWDTLVDVTSDTGLSWLPESWIGRTYGCFLGQDVRILFVNRSIRNILKNRSELKHDSKLERRIKLYSKLAYSFGWSVIGNNGLLGETKSQIKLTLGL